MDAISRVVCVLRGKGEMAALAHRVRDLCTGETRDCRETLSGWKGERDRTLR